MNGFGTVSQQAYEMVCRHKKYIDNAAYIPYAENKKNIDRTHKRHFEKMMELMELENHVDDLKQNRRFVFEEQGKELLSEVLFLIDIFLETETNPNTKKKGGESQKNFLKKILSNDQYDAVVSKAEIRRFQRMIETNKIVVKMLECFYQLFLDAGKTDEETEQIMHSAFHKLRYSERINYNQTFGMMVKYLDTLLYINEEMTSQKTITHTENSIWLDYATEQIERVIKEVVAIRQIMDDVRKEERSTLIGEKFLEICEVSEESEKLEENLIEKSMNFENMIYQLCEEDASIKYYATSYKVATGTELDLRSFVRIALIYNDLELQQKKFYILLSLLGVSASGDDVQIEKKVIQRDEAIENLLKKISEIVESYKLERLPEEEMIINTRNKSLLRAAIARYESDKEKYSMEKSQQLSYACFRKRTKKTDSLEKINL